MDMNQSCAWTVSAGQGRYEVVLRITPTAGSLLAELYGGTRHHLGAWAAAGEGVASASGAFGSHKERSLADSLAQKLHAATGRNVVAVCGLHVDDATKAEIQTLCSHAEEAGQLALRKLLGN